MSRLQALMQGNYTLYGRSIHNGRPNFTSYGEKPGSSGPMLRDQQRQQVVKETKQSQKNEADQTSAPHASSQSQYRAILAKGGNYARNGAEHIRGDTTRAREYNTFTHLADEKDDKFLIDVTSVASIAVPTSNFNPPMSGQRLPYPWRAHHMIPGEAFYTKKADGKPVFDKEENFDIVRQTPYDINHGSNLILLPGVDWAVPVHALLQHPSKHDNYSRDVMRGLQRIDSQINTLRGEPGQSHENIVASVLTELQTLESELWKKLVKQSRAAIESAAKGYLYIGSWCRWRNQEGKPYAWPALF